MRMRFGFLYQGYSFQYWETIDMMRKLIIGAIPVFIAVQPLGSIQVTPPMPSFTCMRRCAGAAGIPLGCVAATSAAAFEPAVSRAHDCGLQAILAQIIFVGSLAATIYIMPFLDFWENITSVTSMAGVRQLLVMGQPHSHICQEQQTLANVEACPNSAVASCDDWRDDEVGAL